MQFWLAGQNSIVEVTWNIWTTAFKKYKSLTPKKASSQTSENAAVGLQKFKW